MADKGEEYGKRFGQEYGWSQDATKNVRIREEGESIENQLVLFPPFAKSRFCNEDPPRMSCSPNYWKIKMKQGLYNVKLIVGDITF